MSEMNEREATRSSLAHGSASDTVSAATMGAAAAGSAGQPLNSPYQSSGPAASGRGPGAQAQQGLNSGEGGVSNMARNAAENVRESAGDLRERAGEAVEQATEWAREQYQEGARQLDDARRRSSRQVQRARTGVERFVSENPMMVGVMGLAAGLIIGALLPRTRQEDRFFGRWADDLRDQGMRYAKEAAQRSRELVEDAINGAEEFTAEDEDRRGSRASGPRYQNH